MSTATLRNNNRRERQTAPPTTHDVSELPLEAALWLFLEFQMLYDEGLDISERRTQLLALVRNYLDQRAELCQTFSRLAKVIWLPRSHVQVMFALENLVIAFFDDLGISVYRMGEIAGHTSTSPVRVYAHSDGRSSPSVKVKIDPTLAAPMLAAWARITDEQMPDYRFGDILEGIVRNLIGFIVAHSQALGLLDGREEGR